MLYPFQKVSALFIGGTHHIYFQDLERVEQQKRGIIRVFHSLLSLMGLSGFIYFLEKKKSTGSNIPLQCRNCRYLHGRAEGGIYLHCQPRPYGPSEENCTDWEAK